LDVRKAIFKKYEEKLGHHNWYHPAWQHLPLLVHRQRRRHRP